MASMLISFGALLCKENPSQLSLIFITDHHSGSLCLAHYQQDDEQRESAQPEVDVEDWQEHSTSAQLMQGVHLDRWL